MRQLRALFPTSLVLGILCLAFGVPRERDLDAAPLGLEKGSLTGGVTMARSVDIKKLIARAQEQHEDLTISKRPEAKQHCVTDVPESAKQAREQQKWRIDKDRGVANVFIWLQPCDEGTVFTIEPNHPTVAAVKDREVVLDAPYCDFEPHAFVLFPSYRSEKKKVNSTGQFLRVKSSAPFAHTAYIDGGGLVFNETLTKEGKLLEPVAKARAQIVTITCKNHKQMKANALVVSNPYYAISDHKGNYAIPNGPVGKVRLFAWHEGVGFLTGDKGQEIELADKETTKNFELKPG
jgi:hypothetical protein